jgi:hypothetical protein
MIWIACSTSPKTNNSIYNSLFNFGKKQLIIKNFTNKYYLFIIFAAFAYSAAYCQIDTTGNFFLTNFNKQYSTYLLGNQARIDLQTKLATFNIRQNYQGTFLKILDRSFRDDEDWSFGYSHLLFGDFALNLNQNWVFSSDSRDIGLSQLQRLNGLVGISYVPNQSSQVQLMYGFENNNQLDLQSQGNIINFKAYQNDYNFQDFILSTDVSLNFLNLNLGRKNQDIDARIRFERYFEDSTNLYLNFDYRKLQTNLLAYSGNDSQQPIEKRVENTIAGNLYLQYQIINPIMIGAIVDYNLINVSRDFREQISSIPYSSFYRDISQNNLNFQIFSKIYIGNFSESIYLNIKNIAEKLSIEKITFFTDSIELKVNYGNKIIYNLFNFYNNDNIIIKILDKKEIKIYSRRELLADMAVAMSEIYNEYNSNYVKGQEVL